MLYIEMLKCLEKEWIQKISYQSTDVIQICPRCIYKVTIKVEEETKRFPSCFYQVPVNKILKGSLARSIINAAGLGVKGNPWQRQVFWWVTMASQTDRNKKKNK